MYCSMKFGITNIEHSSDWPHRFSHNAANIITVSEFIDVCPTDYEVNKCRSNLFCCGTSLHVQQRTFTCIKIKLYPHVYSLTGWDFLNHSAVTWSCCLWNL